MSKKTGAEAAVREFRRKNRRKFSSEEKIRIVLEGLRGEETIGRVGRSMRHTASEKLEIIRLVRGREIRSARALVKRETLRRRRRYNPGLPVTRKDVVRPADVREVSIAMSREVSQRP